MHIRTSFDPQLRRRGKLWGKGPWQREPDMATFWHAGMRCMVRRGPLGNWCGYVLVPEGHPWYGRDYDEVDADVHGGLTFFDQLASIDAWAVGFDCGHCGDLIPFSFVDCAALGRGFTRRMKRSMLYSGTYRTMQWVIRETQHLAEQAREAST